MLSIPLFIKLFFNDNSSKLLYFILSKKFKLVILLSFKFNIFNLYNFDKFKD